MNVKEKQMRLCTFCHKQGHNRRTYEKNKHT
jgi:hypothetical protein